MFLNFEEFKDKLKEALYIRLNNFWVNHVEYGHTRKYLPVWRPEGNKSFTISRKLQRFVTSLFFPQNKLHYFLNKIKLYGDDKCRLCKTEIETADHILCDCKVKNVMKYLQVDKCEDIFERRGELEKIFKDYI